MYYSEFAFISGSQKFIGIVLYGRDGNIYLFVNVKSYSKTRNVIKKILSRKSVLAARSSEFSLSKYRQVRKSRKLTEEEREKLLCLEWIWLEKENEL